MADPLSWKGGEGYDIHVLRGGLSSKSLANAFDMPANVVASSLKFEPGFDRAPLKFGVTVNATTGEVRATLPPTNSSRVEINNFLITASVKDNANKVYSTEIRIHVHDAIDDIWLTPPTLTIRKDSDNSRFTVLAAFSDGVIGDITDWPLNYQSRDPATNSPSADVLVGTDGTLKAVTEGKSADVSVTVTLPSTGSGLPPTLTSAARVTTKPSWLSAAATTNPTFVVDSIRQKDPKNPQRPGTIVPNKADPNSAARNSVASVVANAANILFLAEGFNSEQEFNEVVNRTVRDLRTQSHLEPFRILQDSVNYWSLFLPSQQNGVTLLGDYVVDDSGSGYQLGAHATPPSGATDWSVAMMMHEVGLPIFADPDSLSEMDALWTQRYGPKSYSTLAATSFQQWRAMARQSFQRLAVLNEHDTAFGLRNYDRPRAARRFSTVMLGSDPRRTPDADIFKFIENLNYGGRKIGSTWTTGKDKGRLCFICKTQKHSGINWGGYFLASTGRDGNIKFKFQLTARSATSVALDTPAVNETEKLTLSTVVAHETGHSFKLADEYGDGGGTFRDDNHPEGNLLPKKDITTTTGSPPVTVYNKTDQIKWLWPRVSKAALVSGKPQSTGTRFKVPLQKGHGKPFSPNPPNIVKFRLNPVKVAPTQDAIFNFASGLNLVVTAHSDDEVELALRDTFGNDVPLDAPPYGWSYQLDALFQFGLEFALICPVVAGNTGAGLLVADDIRTHIASSHGPLNADKKKNTTGHEIQVCKPNYSGVMTPTNLPDLTIKPSTVQDIIGLYEGGGGHDCGVFRPGARCGRGPPIRSPFATCAATS